MKAIKLELIVFFCLCVGIAIAQPEFKGGQKALGTFIANSLIYPDYSKMNCLQGTVVVNFKLTGSGRVFNSGIESGFGTDLDEEALRIIQLTSGKWSVGTDHLPEVSRIIRKASSSKSVPKPDSIPELKTRPLPVSLKFTTTVPCRQFILE